MGVNATTSDIDSLDAAALFVKAGDDVHRIPGLSGIDAADRVPGLDTDIDGDARPQGIRCDIGADERKSP